ncbi:MAG: efflux RND transporter periplasmic adaptor subunit [Thermodesulfobacteriota bacterium]
MAVDDLSKLRIEREERAGTSKDALRKRRVIWLAACVLAGLIALGALGWSGLLSRPIEVQAYKVTPTYPSQALALLNASGYVVAQRKAAVSSKATGRLAKLHVEEGQKVKRGDIIASLENRDLEAGLEEARAGVRNAEAMLKNAEAELHDATLNYNRIASLKESGAASVQAHDTAEARLKKAVASERSAKFLLERAHASVRVAEVNLEYSFIRAPFDGVILTKNADEGEVVAPFGGALNAKAAVVTMADMQSLLVEVDVSESNLEKVKPGVACEIRLDALPRDRFDGRVHMIVPTADRSKATVLTKVKFAGLDERVLPEMSVKVAFLSRPLDSNEKEPVLAVPTSAIRNSPKAQTVLRINGSRVRSVPVKTGRKWGDTFEVVSGLANGDQIVLRADGKLSDGDRVRVAQ